MNAPAPMLAAGPAGPPQRTLCEDLTPLGYMVFDLAAFVGGIGANADANLDQIAMLRGVTHDLAGVTSALRDGFDDLGRSARETQAAAACRLDSIAASLARYERLAQAGRSGRRWQSSNRSSRRSLARTPRSRGSRGR